MVSLTKLKIGNVISLSRDDEIHVGLITEVLYDPLTFTILTYANKQKVFCGETLNDDCVFLISSVDDVSCN